MKTLGTNDACEDQGGHMEQSRGITDRYLQLVQEILINSIYQDRAIDPWSQPTFDARKRDGGLDWPQQALTMIGRVRLLSLRECCELVLRDRVPGDLVETGIWRGATTPPTMVISPLDLRKSASSVEQPFQSGPIASSARAAVSRTMIVKNEEANLATCLESVRGVFDEIVVLDTGSKDRTVEIARSFGARVFDFVWVDDFGAARNAALARATGDYAFWLDADDLIEPPERGEVGGVDCGLAGGSFAGGVLAKGDRHRRPWPEPVPYCSRLCRAVRVRSWAGWGGGRHCCRSYSAISAD
jgi:hypothetical protein